MKTNKPKDIDEYIAGFPADIQSMLREIRETVRKTAPDAQETIKYDMPTFMLHGNLIHFAAFKKHIGMYAVPRGVEGFEELSNYGGEKGTAQFPLDKPMPLDLISRIVKYNVQRNLRKSAQ